jgi:hypothetical protein
MTERKNTIVCSFDQSAPRLTAHEVHTWIREELHLTKEEVRFVQMDGFKKGVFIKLYDEQLVTKLLRDTSGRVQCKHVTGEVSYVTVDAAGMGHKRVRVANLPPEAPDHVLTAALATYGQVFEVKWETWGPTYYYEVPSGVRFVTMTLKKHVPSQLMIHGDRVLISYEGQPQTCYGCGESGHLLPTCPVRRSPARKVVTSTKPTYASVVGLAVQATEQFEVETAPGMSGPHHDPGLPKDAEDRVVAPRGHAGLSVPDPVGELRDPEMNLEMQMAPTLPLPKDGGASLVSTGSSQPLIVQERETLTKGGLKETLVPTGRPVGEEVVRSETWGGQRVRATSLPDESRNKGGGDATDGTMEMEFLKTKSEGRSDDNPQHPKRLKQTKHGNQGKMEPPLAKGPNAGARRGGLRAGRI